MRNFSFFILITMVSVAWAKDKHAGKSPLMGIDENIDQGWPKLGRAAKDQTKVESEEADDLAALSRSVPAERGKENEVEGDASILKKRRMENYRPRLQGHSAGVGLGQTFLRGDFKKNGEDQVTPDLYYAYTASYSFDVLGNLHYSQHREGDRSVTIMGAAAAIKSRLYNFDSLSPFVLGGLGFYRPKTSRNQSGENYQSKGKTVFGTNLGAGVDLRLNPQVTVGALVHYHNPFDIKNQGGPDLEGSYYKLLLTLMYSF